MKAAIAWKSCRVCIIVALRAAACMLSELRRTCCTMLKVQLRALSGAPPHARMLFAAKFLLFVCYQLFWNCCGAHIFVYNIYQEYCCVHSTCCIERAAVCVLLAVLRMLLHACYLLPCEIATLLSCYINAKAAHMWYRERCCMPLHIPSIAATDMIQNCRAHHSYMWHAGFSTSYSLTFHLITP